MTQRRETKMTICDYCSVRRATRLKQRSDKLEFSSPRNRLTGPLGQHSDWRDSAWVETQMPWRYSVRCG